MPLLKWKHNNVLVSELWRAFECFVTNILPASPGASIRNRRERIENWRGKGLEVGEGVGEGVGNEGLILIY